MEHTKDKPTIAVLLFSAVRAQIAMFLTGLALLFLFCAVAYSLADPDTVVVPLSLAALFAGGLEGLRRSGFPETEYCPAGCRA